jgi:hypothetical protein
MRLYNSIVKKILSMLISKPIIEKSMAEELSLIIKKVLFMKFLGRTLLTWRPRRLGKGEGHTRATKQELAKIR